MTRTENPVFCRVLVDGPDRAYWRRAAEKTAGVARRCGRSKPRRVWGRFSSDLWRPSPADVVCTCDSRRCGI